MFSELIFSSFAGQGQVEDLPAMARLHPLFDEYWADKLPDFQAIDVPAYFVASWTNPLHTDGTFRAWRAISSQEKWLRVNNTHEWTDYYQSDKVDDLRRFFDHYLKSVDNGWEFTPKVRLSVLDPGHRDTVNRAEADFPLARQTIVPLYLGAGAGLFQTPTDAPQEASYASDNAAGAAFRLTFDRDTEITGYINLKLWVEARGNDDMDLFAFVKKIDRNGQVCEPLVVTGKTHAGPNGRLRVSCRALDVARSTVNEPFLPFDRAEKLAPGEIVPVEIGFWPYSMKWHAGDTLELIITGTDLLVRPELTHLPRIQTLNKGQHVIHFGGQFVSQLVLPVIE
jgi:putative CocE/NonD family hydrolase